MTSLIMVQDKLINPFPKPWYKKLETIPAPVNGRHKHAIRKYWVIPGTNAAVSDVYANKSDNCGANTTNRIVTALPNKIPNLEPKICALDIYSPFLAPYALPLTAVTALPIAVRGMIANKYNRFPELKAAIPYSPPIVAINDKYIDIAIDITNMSIEAGIPTFNMSLTIFESHLNFLSLT